MHFAVVMPVFNEQEGIMEFLHELSSAFTAHEVTYVVVNDCSTDGTLLVLDSLKSEPLDLSVYTNPVNCGHGPSTIRALKIGLELAPDGVIAIDGDGQFIGEDVAGLAQRFANGDVDILEGSRTHRSDPMFRQIVTQATRLLVQMRSGLKPKDANTPLRIYKPSILKDLLHDLPADLTIPNLHISAMARRRDFLVVELPVRSIPRRGVTEIGTTWGAGRRWLPTQRFVRFCFRSLRQWFRLAK